LLEQPLPQELLVQAEGPDVVLLALRLILLLVRQIGELSWVAYVDYSRLLERGAVAQGVPSFVDCGWN